MANCDVCCYLISSQLVIQVREEDITFRISAKLWHLCWKRVRDSAMGTRANLGQTEVIREGRQHAQLTKDGIQQRIVWTRSVDKSRPDAIGVVQILLAGLI